MTRLQMVALGAYQVVLDGKEIVDFPTQKVRALLAYLVVEAARAHTRESLAGLLWPDHPQERAMHNLRQAISGLRRLLPEYWLVEGDGIQFDRGKSYELDLIAFQQGCEQGLARDTHGRINPLRLREAVDLYRGSFLGQFSLKDSSPFEEWLLLQRVMLSQKAVECFDALVDYHERRGEYPQARQYAARLVALLPWNENAHASLMRLYALEGQYAAAENQYRICRQITREQFGVEPLPETARLFTSIREHTFTAPDSHAALRRQLDAIPAAVLPLIGREGELGELFDLLSQPACRLVTLHGLGGVGKTRLAQEAARCQVGLFADGVYVISLADLTAANQLAAAVSRGIGMSLTEYEDAQDQLCRHLRAKEMLLVLDNFDHLLESASTLADWLAQAPRLVCLVTSRQRLNLRQEQVYNLSGLSCVQEEASIEAGDAVQLFKVCTWRSSHGHEFSPVEMGAVRRICQSVEGLPLAVELLASSAATRGVEAIERSIQDTVRAIEAGFRDVPERYRSLWAAFEYSWKLLQPEERLVFSRLGVHAGSFNEQAALNTARASPASIHALLERSLLRRVAPNRLQFHPLVSQFSREKLAEDPREARLVDEWYCDFYLEWTGELDLSLLAEQPVEALQVYTEELPNLLRAWELLLPRDPMRLQILLVGLFTLYDLQGRYQEGIDLFCRALKTLTESTAAPALQAALNIYVGALYQVWGHGDEARAYLQAGQVLADANKLPRESARALVYTIRNLHQAGEYAQVGGKIDEVLELARQAGDAWTEATALFLRGVQAYREGRIEDARTALEVSLVYARRLKAPLMITSPLNTLGDLLCFTGEYPRAIEVFNECLEISRRLDSPYQISIHTNNLGTVYHCLDMLDQASQMYTESLAYCRLIDDQLGMAVALSNLGEVALALHQPDQARDYHRQALTIGETLKNRWTELMALNNLTEIALLQKDLEQAAGYLRRTAEKAIEVQAVTMQMKVLLNLARLLDLRGQPTLACQVMQTVRDHPASEQDLRQHAQNWLAHYTGAVGTTMLSPQEMLQQFIQDKGY